MIEGVPLYQSSKKIAGLFFKRLGLFLIDTNTRRLKKRYKYYQDKKWLYFIFSMFLGILGWFVFVRRIVRFFDLYFSPKSAFVPLIEKYRPDVIFAADVQNENDVALMQAARLRGIPTVGMFRSWDNPTQSMLRIIPDKLLVGSEEVRKEALEFHDILKNRVAIVGHPHYDRYLRGPTKTKEEFFKEFGLDPRKKLILYAPLGDKFVAKNDIDQYVMEALGEINSQILVRFPPDEKLTLVNFNRPPNMVFDKPGAIFKSNEFNDREITRSDDDRLANSIYYSDIVMSGPTSICLDGVFFDKPVIAVHLYPTPRHFFDTIYCYWFNHYQKLLGTGGVKYVTTKEELSRSINDYFENPELYKEERAKIRSMWFSHADGKSSERLAKEILNFEP